jgi:hypothetical protein
MFIHVFGPDFLRDNQIQIGEDYMKVDQEAYRNHFEQAVKDLMVTDKEFESPHSATPSRRLYFLSGGLEAVPISWGFAFLYSLLKQPNKA